MTDDRLWHIATADFARAVASIRTTPRFALDELIYTWQASYFRFVRTPIADFPTMVDFAAMAVATTFNPSRNVVEWAGDGMFQPIFPDRQLDLMETVRNDCLQRDEGDAIVPDWLCFDGDIVDAFEFYECGGPLCDIAKHQIYRTASSYFYLCANHES